MVPLSVRVASILLWINAIGFGIFCVPAILNLLNGHDIPYVMGFPAYGKGPFEQIGVPTTVPLLVGFLLVCIFEGVAGWMVWGGSKNGAILAFLLLPVGTTFWWGFALPIAPIFAIAATILIVVGWKSFK